MASDKEKKQPKRKQPKRKKPTKRTSAIVPEVPPSTEKQPFRIVGIGASAGGLEAFEQFFSHVPVDSGMAFVIVQHLDPARHSAMPEILMRLVNMPAHEATHGMKVVPNAIYLIPPNKNMVIENGLLQLQEPSRTPGLKLPIDLFLRSLAIDKGQDAIGIILSGTGSDGTLGLSAIKSESGTVFVQDPKTAKYDGMPLSAINTGLVDFIVPPQEMPQRLMDFVGSSSSNGSKTGVCSEEVQEPLQQVFAVLRTNTGHDFSQYKTTTIHRRLQRRMSVNQMGDVSTYARFLKEHPDEVKALVKDILISVTRFFRDPKAFDALKVRMKALIKDRPEDGELRVWVAGCATGEEAYSVLSVLSECLEDLGKHLSVQMYATDIDAAALNIARAGVYPANIVADVGTGRLKRFFTKQGDSYRIKKEIREMVVFAPHNLIKDPPFSKMDLICCRNLLIYLKRDLQKRLMPVLHYAIRPGGILLLGNSETVSEFTDLFTVLDKKWNIYQRRAVAIGPDRMRFAIAVPASFRGPVAEKAMAAAEPKISEITEKIFLDNYAPTFAVVDERQRLVYVRGRTGRYLEIVSGQPSLSIVEMAREGLRRELALAIHRATSEKKEVVVEEVQVRYNGGLQTISLTVAPLTAHGMPPGLFMVVFQELGQVVEAGRVAKPGIKSLKRVAELEEALNLTRESLQATIEELEAANEELKSANEELQSNNEELQSTNEELDTSREELQSVNEELLTVNAELQSKNDLVTEANDDLKNFLNRTDIAVIFLDEKLKIRRYTPATIDVFNIREVDTGRPLSDVTSRLVYSRVIRDSQEVLRTLQPRETEVQRDDGYWYSMRISPYLTAQNVVSGLVMSFLDINEPKKVSESLRETSDYLENLLSHTNAPIIVWNAQLKITRFNRAFERLTGRSADQVLGKKVDILLPKATRAETLAKINRSLEKGELLEVVEIPIRHVDGSIRTVLWNSAAIFNADGNTVLATIAQGQDITDRKQMEVALKQRTSEVEAINEELEAFDYSVSHDLKAPLRSIEGFAQALSEDYADRLDDQGKDYLQRVRAASQNMCQIIDGLLQLSGGSRADIVWRRVDLTKIAKQIAGQLQDAEPERRGEFVIAPHLVTHGDPVLLKTVLQALLGNAWKFASKSSRPMIEFGRTEEDGHRVYYVKDNGVGFDMAHADKLFTAFQRLQSADSFPGLGIGLATVRRIVKRHGGRVWAEGETGRGATFYFTLEDQAENK
jgi:two-component system, chemotaxis family, CheB/CheR fusion protein